MLLRRHLPFLLLGILSSLGAQFRTQNFVVEAPTPQIAQQIGQAAEQYRREKAREWLGYEMPAWGEPCPIRVKVTMSGAGGATTFAFDRGQVLSQHMQIEGSLDRLVASVLPHEITHTVFAFYFRCPVPRWADEGGSVLSEDDLERGRHDQIVRQILNAGRAIPLRRLFALKEYPAEVMALYAQGFSVASFLVGNSSRPAFLNFVAYGMQYGWDAACQAHYSYRTVEELEQAWLSHLRATKQRPPAALIAQGNAQPAPFQQTGQTVVRLTAPPAQPMTEGQPLAQLQRPVFRAQAPDDEPTRPLPPVPSSRPAYLPPAAAAAPTPVPGDRWQPTTNQPRAVQSPMQQPPAPQPAPAPRGMGVQIGAPQPLVQNPIAPAPRPQSVSPVGYPQ